MTITGLKIVIKFEAFVYLSLFTGMATIFTLSALAVQRCLLVWFPVTFSYSPDFSKVTIIIIWMLAGAIAAPPLFGWSEYRPESTGIT